MNDIFKQTTLLEKALDFSWYKSETLAHNIANVDTPGYKAIRINFKSALQSYMNNNSFKAVVTNNKHINIGNNKFLSNSKPIIYKDESTSMRIDGNNVDIERESVEFAENKMYYDAVIQKLNKQLGRIRFAISEGK